LLCYQNLSTSHIWLAKSMAIFLLNLASQIFSVANFGRKSIRCYVFTFLLFSKGPSVCILLFRNCLRHQQIK
jgi:hypothetical protein